MSWMTSLKDGFGTFAADFSGYVWGVPLAIVLTTMGLLFTVVTLGIQFKAITHGFQVIRGKFDSPDDEGNISHFQALCTALSATIGLGNISGVATAVAIGGAGAVFWMWIVGFLGMATKFMTCSLATMYREEDVQGTYRGGPMYYIEIGLGPRFKFLAIAFALLGCLASLGAGNMFQSNQVATIVKDLVKSQYEIGLTGQQWVQIAVGALLFALSLLVIIGGIKRIGAVASRVVPTMCLIYCLGALYVIIVNANLVPGLIGSIFREAFSGHAVEGAFWGVVFREVVVQGVKRACFSNEAGLGSAPIAHAAARTNEPIREGVVAAVGPFIDTIVICTMTALVVLITGSHTRPAVATVGTVHERVVVEREIDGASTGRSFLHVDLARLEPDSSSDAVRVGETLLLVPPADERSAMLARGETDHTQYTAELEVIEAGESGLLARVPHPAAGEDTSAFDREVRPLLAPGRELFLKREGVSLTAYAFNQVIPGFGSWFLPFAAFFFAFSTIISWGFYGETCTQYLFGQRAVLPFKLAYVLMVLIGATFTTLKPVLDFSDAMLGLMLVPNLIGTLLLTPRVVSASRDYFGRLKAGAFDADVAAAAEAKRRARNTGE